MPVDLIRYDILVQNALRGMVREVLVETVKQGLPGEHHFFITFDTTAAGVRLSDRLRAQYPAEMTVVLQHQFWDLKVTEDAFEVGLSFGGVPERLTVPFVAVRAFTDPSVQFTLQFETLDEAPPDAAGETGSSAESPASETPASGRAEPRGRRPGSPARTSVPSSRPSAASSADQTDDDDGPDGSGGPNAGGTAPGEGAGAEVVRLDRFRKK